MSHLDSAMLHEYLDRGAVDDSMKAVSRHVVECDVCTRLLHTVEAEREEASGILRAAVPLQRPMPLFETLVPRPKYETFDGGVPSDISLHTTAGEFKQSSIGIRGQAVMFAWAATIVLALGAGWFANAMYRANATRGVGAAASTAQGPNADTNAANAAAPAPDVTAPDVTAANTHGGPVAAAGVQSTTADAAKRSAESRGRVAESEGANIGAGAVTPPPAREVAAAPAPAPAASVAEARSSTDAVATTGDRNPLAQRDQASNKSIVTGALATEPLRYPATWSSISEDSAAVLLGGSIVGVYGAAVLDYAVGAISADASPTRVRVRQVTVSRDTMEVMQSQPVSIINSLRATSRQSPPLADSRANSAVRLGTLGSRFYQASTWTDGRSVTVIGGDSKRLQDIKLHAFAPRKTQ